MTALRSLALLTLLGACQYDIDGIYKYTASDSGPPRTNDAAMQPVGRVSTQLIGAWTGYPSVDAECVACAEAQCAEVDASCRADPTCVAYTECVAHTPTPAGQAACREQFAEWVAADNVRARDLVGPYGQCVFRDNCAAACEGNNDLSCAGSYGWPTTAVASVPMRLFLVDANDQKLVHSNIRVRVCELVDTNCSSPRDEGVTDERGSVQLSLPIGFSRAFTGYLEVRGGALYPTLIKFGWHIGQESVQVINVVSQVLIDLSSTYLEPKVVTDPARGMLQLRMLGCLGLGTRGVRFRAESADSQSIMWYLNQVPSRQATETDGVGSAGVLNVPVGNTRVTATRVSDEKLLADTTAPVRAGYMTVVIFAPAPSQ